MYSGKNLSLFLILLVGFLDYMGIGMIYPIFASLFFDKTAHFLSPDASDALRGMCLGILLALMPIAQFFSAPILGTLSDQKGRKRVLIGALSLAIMAYLIAVFAVMYQNLMMLFLYRILAGIAAGSAAVVQASIVDVSTREDKIKNFSLFNMAMGSGYTIGPLIGGILTDSDIIKGANYELPFWFSLFMITANLLLVIWFYRETRPVDSLVSISWLAGLENIRKAISMRGLRVLFLSIFVFCFGWSFFFEFIPVFLIGQYSFSCSNIGNFYAYSGGFYALSCGFLIQPLIHKLKAKHLLHISLYLSGLYMFLFLTIEQSMYLWLYVPLLLYLIALIFPTSTAMVSNYADEKSQGEVLGVLLSVQSAAFSVSPLFSGALVGLYYTMPIILGGICFIIAGLIFRIFLAKNFIPEKERQTTDSN